MRTLLIFRRELGGYFATPVAYVFIVIFLALRRRADLLSRQLLRARPGRPAAVLQLHPWLYLFLVPAISMRLWAEERKTGTIELLLTLPISLGEAVLGKFLAAWASPAIALALTFPLWLTVNLLGDPDNGVILAGYVGSLLMAGGFLAIGACVSAITKNQVIAFVLTRRCLLPVHRQRHRAGARLLHRLAPPTLVDASPRSASSPTSTRSAAACIDVRDLVFFALADRALPVRQRDRRRPQEGGLSDDGCPTASGAAVSPPSPSSSPPRCSSRSTSRSTGSAARPARRPDPGPALHALARHAVGAGGGSTSRSRCGSTSPSDSAREIPSYGVYATRVREMLQEYRAAARGKIDLEIIDPEPFSDEEDRALAFGLQGVPVNQAGELVYFGLAGTNTADNEEVIPSSSPSASASSNTT